MEMVDIPFQRLRNQHITGAKLADPAGVVSWLGAVQAQDYYGAIWSLGLRMTGATAGDIEQAFNEGAILRTHMLRPTWHFVTPADIRWMQMLTAQRVHAANNSRYRQLDLDNALLHRSDAVIGKALEGGKFLTRDELRDVLLKSGIEKVVGQQLAYIVMHAELEGIICSGPRRGKQFTYALLAERAPQARMFKYEEALAELTRRFFLSRGPATVQDFAKWSGLTIADARSGLEAVQTQLHHEQVEGQSFWFSPPNPAVQDASPQAYLLSIYDEYISGYKDRRAIIEPEYGKQLVGKGSALSYILVMDGRVVGTWRRTMDKKAVVIETNPFQPLSPAENQAVAAAAEQYGQFFGLPVAHRE